MEKISLKIQKEIINNLKLNQINEKKYIIVYEIKTKCIKLVFINFLIEDKNKDINLLSIYESDDYLK